MEEEKMDVKSLCALLSQENKRYVIAVANALLFSQKKEEVAKVCELSASHRA